MGILNVTPDSFSDGGQFQRCRHAPSPMPGAWPRKAPTFSTSARNPPVPTPALTPVSADDELARLKPVLPAVVKLGLPVSIDTIKAEVAAWALDQGATIVNDVWGLQRDPDMARARRQTPRAGHRHAQPRRAADPAIDIVADMSAFFARSLEIAAQAGIARDTIVLDPGIGFGKTPEQSIVGHRPARRVARHSACRCWSAPRASASSTTSTRAARPSASAARIAATCWRSQNGAAIIRAHDVAETVQALRVAGGHPGRPMKTQNDRPRFRQRACAARLSRRDAARGQGRPDLQARSRRSTSI